MNTKENKGMCALVENGLYADDDFELLNVLDLPDNLEGDGCIEDWSMNLGPIPADIFAEAPSVTRVCDSMDFLSMNAKESFKTQLKQHSSTFLDERKMYRIPKSFEAPSPDSVLERRSSTSAEKAKTIPLGPEVTIPVKARTNRSRPVSTSNSWSKSLLLVPLEKARKKRRLVSELPDSEDKKCTHCEITKTPQWREGPMGPKTLCNACGVRYRSGRLFPEYRPAASPTFIPSLHSNCHRKVIEMRQKGVGVDGRSFGKKPRTAISYPVGVGYGAFVKKPATTIPYPFGAGAGDFVKKLTATAMPYPAGVGDGVFVKKPTATPISYPVGVGDGVFVKKPATTMPYTVKVEDGGFVKKPTATAISYSAGPEDGFFVKKPTATPISYPVGVGDGVFVKKPATTMPYPVGAGDEGLVKKPTATAIPCPVGAGDEGFVKKPEITIPFPAGAGYGVFVNKPTGSIPTLTRLGSD